MSAIGKVFIVLNLVFSLVIVGAAASYLSKADDWKTKYDDKVEEFKTAKDEWDAEANTLRADLDRATEDVQFLQGKNDGFKSENDSLNDQVERMKVSEQQLRDAVDGIRESLNDFNGQINDLRHRNNGLADSNNSLKNEALDAKEKQKSAEDDLVRTEGDLATANDRISELETALAGLDQEKTHVESLLNIARSKGFDISSLVAMPDIDAEVVEVDNSLGFVILSAGSEQGVAKGFTFQLYRGKEYLGEVEVDNLWAKRCAARIKLLNEGAAIQIHDSASTVL